MAKEHIKPKEGYFVFLNQIFDYLPPGGLYLRVDREVQEYLESGLLLRINKKGGGKR